MLTLTANQIEEFKSRLTRCDESEVWGEVKDYSNEITEYDVFIDVLEDIQSQLCVVAESATLQNDAISV